MFHSLTLHTTPASAAGSATDQQQPTGHTATTTTTTTTTEQHYGDGETTYEAQLAHFARACRAAPQSPERARATAALHAGVRNMAAVDDIWRQAGVVV